MLRRCVHCGVERETTSVRSSYVCPASRCQVRARYKGFPGGKRRGAIARKVYFKRLKRIRNRTGVTPYDV